MTTVRLSKDEYDGTIHDEVIEQLVARTGFDREAVERMLGAFYVALLEQSGGESVVLEDIGAVFVPEGYPDVEFVVAEFASEGT